MLISPEGVIAFLDRRLTIWSTIVTERMRAVTDRGRRVAQAQVGHERGIPGTGVSYPIGKISTAAVASITQGFTNAVNGRHREERVRRRIQRAAAGVCENSTFQWLILLDDSQSAQTILSHRLQPRPRVNITPGSVYGEGFVSRISGKQCQRHVTISVEVPRILRGNIRESCWSAVTPDIFELNDTDNLTGRKADGFVCLVESLIGYAINRASKPRGGLKRIRHLDVWNRRIGERRGA